jgi:hypothetical protein
MFDLGEEPPSVPWRHNTLHDLESLWWVGLWVAFTFRDESVTPDTNTKLAFKRYFGDVRLADRQTLLTQNHLRRRLKEAFANLPNNQGIFTQLIAWAVDLRQAYEEWEEVDSSRLDDIVRQLIERMRVHISAIIVHVSSQPSVRYSNPDAEQSAKAKPKREDVPSTSITGAGNIWD